MEKYGIWAVRSARSQFGAKAAWAKDRDNKIIQFSSREDAEKEVESMSRDCMSPNVRYYVKEF